MIQTGFLLGLCDLSLLKVALIMRWTSSRSRADGFVHHLLSHVGLLADTDIGSYTWTQIGTDKNTGQPLLKVTFASDVTVDRLIAFAPGLRYDVSSYGTTTRRRLNALYDSSPSALGLDDLKNIYLRRSLSKEERETANSVKNAESRRRTNARPLPALRSRHCAHLMHFSAIITCHH